MRAVRCVVALLVSCCWCVASAGPVFNYTGKNFSSGSYLNYWTDYIWASITLIGADYAGRTLGLSDLGAWAIGIAPDNELRITSESATAQVKLASFTFNEAGVVTAWHFDVLANPCGNAACTNVPELYTFGNSNFAGMNGYTRDQAVFRHPSLAAGAVANNAGAWTMAAAEIPEPSSWVLAGSALLGALLARRSTLPGPVGWGDLANPNAGECGLVGGARRVHPICLPHLP